MVRIVILVNSRKNLIVMVAINKKARFFGVNAIFSNVPLIKDISIVENVVNSLAMT